MSSDTRFYKRQSSQATGYCEVSVNVATGCPNPYGASAVTVTPSAVDGSVSVTDATPELLVTAIIFEPLVVPFESEPALVVKRMLAPALPPPDVPAVNVTVKGTGSVLPGDPVCASPSVLANVAAGFPTTIHPPCVCVALLSFPVTVKWQKPGVFPAATVISPG